MHAADQLPAMAGEQGGGFGVNGAQRLLVIEDDRRVAAYLKQGLSESGFMVDVAADGIEGKYLASEGRYAVVLLDVMLPGLDGFDVLRAIRSSRLRHTPVLMLTARDQLEDRVKGLQAGADDYLPKPFAFSELLARIGALMRRGQAAYLPPASLLRLANLEIDLLARKVTRAGQRIDLTAKEFQLLALLMERRGQILSRTVLAERIWDMNFNTETNMVEVAVRRLRAKIDDPFSPKLLHNVRGMGYVLEERGA
jgi:two-component system, OmpR family, copper resistance phosphate regulon response regulator CusR